MLYFLRRSWLRLFTMSALLVGAVLIICCNRPAASTDQLQVVASFYPLGYVAERIGGDRAEVVTVIPASVEPHDFAPTPQDIIQVTTADLFIYNGAGLDPWAEAIPASDFTQPQVQRVEATEGIASARGGSASGGESAEHTEEHGDRDPHVWLDPVLMQTIVQKVLTAYQTADPTNADYYQTQATGFLTELQQLDTNYQTTLSSCRIHTAIVAHDAFHYLAERYDLDLVPIVGLNPNEAPSAQTISKLTDLAQAQDIHYIFFETLVSPKLSEVLAQEVGAETLVLSPVEGLSAEEQAVGENYISIMQHNLERLAVAMDCPPAL